MDEKITTDEMAGKLFNSFSIFALQIGNKVPRSLTLVAGLINGEILGRMKERFLNKGELTRQDIDDIAYNTQNDSLIDGPRADDMSVKKLFADISSAADGAFEIAIKDADLPPMPRGDFRRIR